VKENCPNVSKACNEPVRAMLCERAAKLTCDVNLWLRHIMPGQIDNFVLEFEGEDVQLGKKSNAHNKYVSVQYDNLKCTITFTHIRIGIKFAARNIL
jgi:hypothetical protein